MTNGLHPRQAAILAYVDAYKGEHGYSPSLAEIGKAVGSSQSGAYVHVLQLIAKGYMTRGEGKSRTYNVVKR